MGNVRCEDLQSIIIEPPICYYPIHRHNRHIYYAQYNTALPHVEIYAKWYSLPHRKSIRKLLASLGVSCVCPRQHESIVLAMSSEGIGSVTTVIPGKSCKLLKNDPLQLFRSLLISRCGYLRC